MMPSSDDKLFSGRWKLESCIGRNGDKKMYPIGERPFGMLTYTERYVMVFISSAQRSLFSTSDIRAVPGEQIVADFPKFESYCGHYEVDHQKKIVSHFIENSKIPNQIGTVFRRHFSFKDEQLVLQTTDSLLLDGEPWLFELAWNRQE